MIQMNLQGIALTFFKEKKILGVVAGSQSFSVSALIY